METIKYFTAKEIRAVLKKKFGKDFCTQLARLAKKSKPWVSRHITGTLKTKGGRKFIAQKMGKVDGQMVSYKNIYPE